MRTWTHWVTCNETKSHYHPSYDIKAVQDKNGDWRCSERNLCGVQYANKLSNVTIIQARGDKLC